MTVITKAIGEKKPVKDKMEQPLKNGHYEKELKYQTLRDGRQGRFIHTISTLNSPVLVDPQTIFEGIGGSKSRHENTTGTYSINMTLDPLKFPAWAEGYSLTLNYFVQDPVLVDPKAIFQGGIRWFPKSRHENTTGTYSINMTLDPLKFQCRHGTR
ncbi:hypothetical protein KQX54_001348 [Cotesia glomerata]|uniref:Uncharacterized protein n=1 Tax=Cotesia glomerata TaxID=32391 RepID=A0AAV7IJA3_COTGL|nr:hypothetical protein KQX54_001348 [Cotesia glomerata]